MKSGVQQVKQNTEIDESLNGAQFPAGDTHTQRDTERETHRETYTHRERERERDTGRAPHSGCRDTGHKALCPVSRHV